MKNTNYKTLQLISDIAAINFAEVVSFDKNFTYQNLYEKTLKILGAKIKPETTLSDFETEIQSYKDQNPNSQAIVDAVVYLQDFVNKTRNISILLVFSEKKKMLNKSFSRLGTHRSEYVRGFVSVYTQIETGEHGQTLSDIVKSLQNLFASYVKSSDRSQAVRGSMAAIEFLFDCLEVRY